MALLTSSIILKEFMKELTAQSVYLKLVNKQYTDKFGEKSGDVSKGGTDISIKTPAQVSVRNGRTSTFVTPDEGSTTLSVNTFKGVDLKFTDVDLDLSVDAFKDRWIKSAASALAAEVDEDIANSAYKGFAMSVGTPGTTPSALKTFNLMRAKLVNAGVPKGDDVHAILSTDAQVELADAIKAYNSPNSEISKAFLEGMIGRGAGMKFWESPHVPAHTVGPLGGTPLVNGASQGITTGTANTTTLATDGWTAVAAARLKAGDVFTIDGVYDVDPLTKQNRNYLKQFTVTADYSSTAGGAISMVISPAIISGGAYQNVSAAPANDAPISMLGAANTVSPQNIVMHPDAVTFASIPLILPRGTDMAERVSARDADASGLSIRLVRDWDNAEGELNTRIDVFYGIKVVRPWWGGRVWG